jgi:hypothetical protein
VAVHVRADETDVLPALHLHHRQFGTRLCSTLDLRIRSGADVLA